MNLNEAAIEISKALAGVGVAAEVGFLAGHEIPNSNIKIDKRYAGISE